MNLSVIYYSDNRVAPPLQRFCLDSLGRAAEEAGAELVCVTWTPVPAPKSSRQIVWPRHVADHCNLYRQILAGIAAARGRIVALAEHDVLYPPGYLEALADSASAGLCYNTNVWRLNRYGFFRASEARQRGFPVWAEPAADAEFVSPRPVVDIRHGRNFTGERRPRNGRYRGRLEYWGEFERYARLWQC